MYQLEIHKYSLTDVICKNYNKQFTTLIFFLFFLPFILLRFRGLLLK